MRVPLASSQSGDASPTWRQGEPLKEPWRFLLTRQSCLPTIPRFMMGLFFEYHQYVLTIKNKKETRIPYTRCLTDEGFVWSQKLHQYKLVQILMLARPKSRPNNAVHEIMDESWGHIIFFFGTRCQMFNSYPCSWISCLKTSEIKPSLSWWKFLGENISLW